VWENALDVGHAAIGNEALDGTTDHGVLAHQDDTFATERLTNLVHLLGGDIVDGDNEDGLVLLDEGLELVKVDVFWRLLVLKTRLEMVELTVCRANHCVIWQLTFNWVDVGSLSQIGFFLLLRKSFGDEFSEF